MRLSGLYGLCKYLVEYQVHLQGFFNSLLLVLACLKEDMSVISSHSNPMTYCIFFALRLSIKKKKEKKRGFQLKVYGLYIVSSITTKQSIKILATSIRLVQFTKGWYFGQYNLPVRNVYIKCFKHTN